MKEKGIQPVVKEHSQTDNTEHLYQSTTVRETTTREGKLVENFLKIMKTAQGKPRGKA